MIEPSGETDLRVDQPGEPTHAPNTLEALPCIEELKARLDAMGEWAAKTQSHAKGLASGIQILESRTNCIASLQQNVELLASQLAETHHHDPTGVVDHTIGYQPSPGQQAELFAALAEWQLTAATLEKGQTANIATRNGATVSYRYADIAAVSEIARSAGASGLSHFHREIVINGQNFIRTYLLHRAGGWVSCDVPLLIRENSLISSLQQWASACTMARRYGLFMVLAIAAAEDDDDGAGDSRARNSLAPAAASQGAGLRQAPPSRTTATGPAR